MSTGGGGFKAGDLVAQMSLDARRFFKEFETVKRQSIQSTRQVEQVVNDAAETTAQGSRASSRAMGQLAFGLQDLIQGFTQFGFTATGFRFAMLGATNNLQAFLQQVGFAKSAVAGVSLGIGAALIPLLVQLAAKLFTSEKAAERLNRQLKIQQGLQQLLAELAPREAVSGRAISLATPEIDRLEQENRKLKDRRALLNQLAQNTKDLRARDLLEKDAKKLGPAIEENERKLLVLRQKQKGIAQEQSKVNRQEILDSLETRTEFEQGLFEIEKEREQTLKRIRDLLLGEDRSVAEAKARAFFAQKERDFIRESFAEDFKRQEAARKERERKDRVREDIFDELFPKEDERLARIRRRFRDIRRNLIDAGTSPEELSRVAAKERDEIDKERQKIESERLAAGRRASLLTRREAVRQAIEDLRQRPREGGRFIGGPENIIRSLQTTDDVRQKQLKALQEIDRKLGRALQQTT